MDSQFALKALAVGSLSYGVYMLLQCPCPTCVGCNLTKFTAAMGTAGAAVVY